MKTCFKRLTCLFFSFTIIICCISLHRVMVQHEYHSFHTTCQSASLERTNIFFLKAHKCASSTVQNILMRYGYSRCLDFVLPLKDNYIGNPELFKVDMIAPQLTTLNNKYNIFTHHTRYNYSAIEKIMYPQTKFVTILRDPPNLYESLFSYYHLEREFNFTLSDVLNNRVNIKSLNKRFNKKIGVNQMSWDLGLQEQDFKDSKKIRSLIDKIDSEFDLVMISEYMRESLVLLSDLMNWQLENVAYMSLNKRPNKSKIALNETEREVLIHLNSADAALYRFFLEKFKRKVKEYGLRRMLNDVKKLMLINSKLKSQCLYKSRSGYAHAIAFQIQNNAEWICQYMVKEELQFTEEIRSEQINRLYHLKNMHPSF